MVRCTLSFLRLIVYTVVGEKGLSSITIMFYIFNIDYPTAALHGDLLSGGLDVGINN